MHFKEELRIEEKKKEESLSRKMDMGTWGFFLIWIGVAIILDLGWSIGLLGVGIIIIAENIIRSYKRLKMDRFWLFVGLVCLIAGSWEIFNIRESFISIILIAAGVLLLFSVFHESRVEKKKKSS